MNLINSTLKASVEAAMEDLFDSFARDLTLTLYKRPEETIVSLDSNFDGNWNSGNNTVTYEEVSSSSFPARIWYLDYEQQYKEFFFRGENIEGPRVAQDLGQIKLMLKESGYNYIKEASRAVVLGDSWEVTSAEKRVGILDFKYYVIILTKRK
jgi:hypothetical protein